MGRQRGREIGEGRVREKIIGSAVRYGEKAEELGVGLEQEVDDDA